MLSKSSRIPRKLFKSLLEDLPAGPGRRGKVYFNSEHFSLRAAHSEKVRVAVSVSKRVSKSAVTRNTIRRRAYSAIRVLLPNLLPALYLVIAKTGAEKLKGQALEEELANLLKKAKM